MKRVNNNLILARAQQIRDKVFLHVHLIVSKEWRTFT
jgi:hypothetical protein